MFNIIFAAQHQKSSLQEQLAENIQKNPTAFGKNIEYIEIGAGKDGDEHRRRNIQKSSPEEKGGFANVFLFADEILNYSKEKHYTIMDIVKIILEYVFHVSVLENALYDDKGERKRKFLGMNFYVIEPYRHEEKSLSYDFNIGQDVLQELAENGLIYPNSLASLLLRATIIMMRNGRHSVEGKLKELAAREGSHYKPENVFLDAKPSIGTYSLQIKDTEGPLENSRAVRYKLVKSIELMKGLPLALAPQGRLKHIVDYLNQQFCSSRYLPDEKFRMDFFQQMAHPAKLQSYVDWTKPLPPEKRALLSVMLLFEAFIQGAGYGSKVENSLEKHVTSKAIMLQMMPMLKALNRATNDILTTQSNAALSELRLFSKSADLIVEGYWKLLFLDVYASLPVAAAQMLGAVAPIAAKLERKEIKVIQLPRLQPLQQDRIGGSSYSSGVCRDCDDPLKQYLIKTDPIYKPNGTPDIAAVGFKVAKECLGTQLYGTFGVRVPHTGMFMHRMLNSYADSQMGVNINAEFPHMVSQLIKDFYAFGGNKNPQFTPAKPLESDQKISGSQAFFEKISGVGTILAVALWLNDIDVIGGSGSNIGWIRQERNAIAVKIDAGEAFSEYYREIKLNGIRIATVGSSSAVLKVDQLPRSAQDEFFNTLSAIDHFDLSEIERFCAQKPFSDYFNANNIQEIIQFLDHRRAVLQSLYQQSIAPGSMVKPTSASDAAAAAAAAGAAPLALSQNKISSPSAQPQSSILICVNKHNITANLADYSRICFFDIRLILGAGNELNCSGEIRDQIYSFSQNRDCCTLFYNVNLLPVSFQEAMEKITIFFNRPNNTFFLSGGCSEIGFDDFLKKLDSKKILFTVDFTADLAIPLPILRTLIQMKATLLASQSFSDINQQLIHLPAFSAFANLAPLKSRYQYPDLISLQDHPFNQVIDTTLEQIRRNRNIHNSQLLEQCLTEVKTPGAFLNNKDARRFVVSACYCLLKESGLDVERIGLPLGQSRSPCFDLSHPSKMRHFYEKTFK